MSIGRKGGDGIAQSRFTKSLVLAPDRQSNCKCCENVYISLPYIVAARAADIDRNEKTKSLSPCVMYRSGVECCRSPRSTRPRVRTAGCSAKDSICTSSSATRSNRPSRSSSSTCLAGVSVAHHHHHYHFHHFIKFPFINPFCSKLQKWGQLLRDSMRGWLDNQF